jgi:hypothetical protein
MTTSTCTFPRDRTNESSKRKRKYTPGEETRQGVSFWSRQVHGIVAHVPFRPPDRNIGGRKGVGWLFERWWKFVFLGYNIVEELSTELRAFFRHSCPLD